MKTKRIVLAALLLATGMVYADYYSTGFEEPIFEIGVTPVSNATWDPAGGVDNWARRFPYPDGGVPSSTFFAITADMAGTGQAFGIIGTDPTSGSIRAYHSTDDSASGMVMTENFAASFDFGYTVSDGVTATNPTAYVGISQFYANWQDGVIAGINADAGVARLGYCSTSGWVYNTSHTVQEDVMYTVRFDVDVENFLYDMAITQGGSTVWAVDDIAYTPTTDDLSYVYMHGYVGTPTGNDGQAYFDNVSIIPEPATMSLICLGAIGLVRRKR